MRQRIATLAARSLDRISERLAPKPPPVPSSTSVTRETIDRIGSVKAEAENALARADYALEVARDMSLPTRMLAYMAWLDLHAANSSVLVSVILCTRDRPQYLARAIPSVIGQRYQRWQLIVVDDGDTEAVAETMRSIVDERIVVVEGPRRGLGSARNVGLASADGEVVCYLDDDNIMHPGWLNAVADTFSHRPDLDVAYGVAITEHRIPGDSTEFGWWPSFWQLPWSRERLLEENVSDAGSVAHRRELDEARFDEGLPTGEDWDLLLRLTADREAMAIPALSHAYTIDGEGRMSDDPAHREGLEAIRRRHAGA